MKSSEKIALTIDQRFEFSFGDFNSFLEDKTLLCLHIPKKEHLDCKYFLVGVFGNLPCSTLGLGDVRKAVLKKLSTSVLSKNCCGIFCEMNTFCLNWEYAF